MEVLRYKVRAMKKSDIPKAASLWNEVGYEEPKHCVKTWFQVDPDGFQVAETEDGDVIGLCCAIICSEKTAFVGMYVVKEEYRGLGIGSAVWNTCMQHVGDRNVGLDAVASKLRLYKDKAGFSVEEVGWHTVICTAEHVDPKPLLKAVEDVQLQEIIEDQLPLVLEYDFSVVGYERGKAIALTVQEGDSASYFAVRHGICMGYGIIRLCHGGCAKVGPLYADSQGIAEVILRRLIEAVPPDNGFIMTIINTNLEALNILDKFGVPFQEEKFPRVYRKAKMEAAKEKVFNVFDQNFCPY